MDYRLPSGPVNTLKEAQDRQQELETLRAILIAELRVQISSLLPFLEIYEKAGTPYILQRIRKAAEEVEQLLSFTGNRMKTTLLDLDDALTNLKAQIERGTLS